MCIFVCEHCSISLQRIGKLSCGAQEVSDFYYYQYGVINAEDDHFY